MLSQNTLKWDNNLYINQHMSNNIKLPPKFVKINCLPLTIFVSIRSTRQQLYFARYNYDC